MDNNENEIVKYVNLLRIKKSKEKSEDKIDQYLNSPKANKLINSLKKKEVENYIQKNMIGGSAENLYRMAKHIQHKYPDMLNNIINFYIAEELGYYLIKMITRVEKIDLEQTQNIVKHILNFEHGSIEDLAENICFMANHFLDMSNTVRTKDFKNQATSILIYEIFNKKNHAKLVEHIKISLAKKWKNSNTMHHMYIPFGEAYTLELAMFDRALNEYNKQIEKEINK